MMMEKSKSFVNYAFFAGLTLAVLIRAQDESGFLSIDCGIQANSSYYDQTTGITYISDEKFINVGIRESISSYFRISGLEQQFHEVRSFPEGVRNCYTLDPEKGKGKGYTYLIRARFMYGNYDGKSKAPEFDLHLGVTIWDTIRFDGNSSSIVSTEILHVHSTNHIHVCLVNTGLGTPFVSALELRLLGKSVYTPDSLNESLVLQRRCDFGSDKPFRYKHDIYDRIWMPENNPDWKILSTSEPVYTGTGFLPPAAVLRTAITTNTNSDDLLYDLGYISTYPTSEYYIYLYFAEVQVLFDNETREFHIIFNKNYFFIDSLAPEYLIPTSKFVRSTPWMRGRFELQLLPTERSTLPPIINALEIYMVKQSSLLPSDLNDVEAITNIKSKYGVERNWQGDPCGPTEYRWDGLGCIYELNSPPRITSL